MADSSIRAPGVVDGGQVQTTYIDARPAALVEGRVIEWGELRPLLNEAAGGQVLQEVILERLLTAELAEAGLIITDDDIDRERKLFYETLDPEPDTAVRLARELRARQGLGQQRFHRLLRRNAGLRALVAAQVVVSEDTVQRAWDALYGPRRQARLIMVATLSEAQQVKLRLDAGDFFGDVAVELSTDSSAARGGLLEPISSADPTYPPALRDELFQMTVGQLSSPILLGNQYALLKLEREIPAQDVAIDDVRPELERLARLAQERILMDQQARALLAGAQMTIIDEALKESWEFQFRQ